MRILAISTAASPMPLLISPAAGPDGLLIGLLRQHAVAQGAVLGGQLADYLVDFGPVALDDRPSAGQRKPERQVHLRAAAPAAAPTWPIMNRRNGWPSKAARGWPGAALPSAWAQSRRRPSLAGHGFLERRPPPRRSTPHPVHAADAIIHVRLRMT